MIAQICRWHLQHDRQVLIFWNNREEVRQLALRLYSLLKDILPPVPPLEQCKKQVLDGCSRQVKSFDGSSLRSTEMTEDELFGILEEDHYRALCSGIGFHSSAVPNELRCYIEEQFLKTGNLKIVCSTETLAYGVNSAVDAVVIADMTKMKGRRQSLLSANEYQNYVGRAGRLRPGLSMEDIVGWVHPIINGHSPEDKRFTNDEGMYTHWMQIRAPKTVDIMYSRVFDPDNQNLPFRGGAPRPGRQQIATMSPTRDTSSAVTSPALAITDASCGRCTNLWRHIRGRRPRRSVKRCLCTACWMRPACTTHRKCWT